jgi:hypothetical protein
MDDHSDSQLQVYQDDVRDIVLNRNVPVIRPEDPGCADSGSSPLCRQQNSLISLRAGPPTYPGATAAPVQIPALLDDHRQAHRPMHTTSSARTVNPMGDGTRVRR